MLQAAAEVQARLVVQWAARAARGLLGLEPGDTPPWRPLNVTAAAGQHSTATPAIDTRAKPIGKLAVDLGVNQGGYSQWLGKRGFHVFGATCGNCPAPDLGSGRDAVGTCRLGEFKTASAQVKAGLASLQQQFPDEDWGYFLNQDGSVRWSDVAITGYLARRNDCGGDRQDRGSRLSCGLSLGTPRQHLWYRRRHRPVRSHEPTVETQLSRLEHGFLARYAFTDTDQSILRSGGYGRRRVRRHHVQHGAHQVPRSAAAMERCEPQPPGHEPILFHRRRASRLVASRQRTDEYRGRSEHRLRGTTREPAPGVLARRHHESRSHHRPFLAIGPFRSRPPGRSGRHPGRLPGQPYKGTPSAIPGRVELANLDTGGFNVSYNADHNRMNSAGYEPISGNDYRPDENDLPNICKTNTQNMDKWGRWRGLSKRHRSLLVLHGLCPRPGLGQADGERRAGWDVHGQLLLGVCRPRSGLVDLVQRWALPGRPMRPHDGVNKTGIVMLPGTSDYHIWKSYPKFATVQLSAGLQVMTFHLEKHDHLQYGFLQFDLVGGSTDAGSVADAGAAGPSGGDGGNTGVGPTPGSAGLNGPGGAGANGTAGAVTGGSGGAAAGSEPVAKSDAAAGKTVGAAAAPVEPRVADGRSVPGRCYSALPGCDDPGVNAGRARAARSSGARVTFTECKSCPGTCRYP